jgi:hypothetical protein
VVTRTQAVQRINDGLGFRPDGHSLESKIILRLQEAQRDLEAGKTLPRFLIREDQHITLLAGEHSAALPEDFIREDDNNRLHFFLTKPRLDEDGDPVLDENGDPIIDVISDIARYLKPKRYNDAVTANLREQGPVGPSIYVIRSTTIDFITRADTEYELIWNYYASGQLLDTDIENEWLRSSPEWLIGEAGYRIAKDLRDPEGVALFDGLRTQGRAATFGDIIADEDATGPYIMGINL